MFRAKLASKLLPKPRRRQPARYVPVLQALEERRLLSTFHEYPVPDNGFGVNLSGITAGPDGNVWFTNEGDRFRSNRGEVEFITPAGAITAFAQPQTTEPAGIVTGADGNLWYGGEVDSFEQPAIGRITTDGTATRFSLPPGFADTGLGFVLTAVTLGPDGNVWYAHSQYTPEKGVIGHISPDGQATSSVIPPDRFGGSAVGGALSMTAGPDGNIWFIPDFVDGHYYAGRVTPDGQYTFFEAPGTDNALWSIAAGPDGNLWASAVRFDRRDARILSASIDQITVNGQFTEFSLPDASHAAASITLGPDGNLWFTEPGANQIGMMTPAGQLTEYAIPTPNSNPRLITAGPDGNIWFTEVGSGQIGEFVLNDGGGVPPPATGPQAVNAAAVETLFAGTGQPVVDGVVSSQPSTVARVDAVFAASLPEAAVAPKALPAEADAGILSHQHKEDWAVAAAAGLADPLAEAL
jgi:streptogramin lyase